MYADKRYTWTEGRLARVYSGSPNQGGSKYESCDFTYDIYGQRISKSYTYDPNPVSTSDYSYTYNTTYDYDHSGRLIREYCTERYISGTTKTREFTYLYDDSEIIGVSYSLNGAAAQSYYYRKNLFGDVVAIYDATGSRKVEYGYDAFGNCKVVYANNSDLANNNPIRYRSYYYDRETKLYYLNARYYNPEWRRFISPDNVESINPSNVNGLNLYCYANNNPVTFSTYNVAGYTHVKEKTKHSISATKADRFDNNIVYSSSFNALSTLGLLLNSFESFDQWSGFLSGGLDSGLNFHGVNGFNNRSISPYIKGLKYFGVAMIIVDSAISFGTSVYNNFNNKNYTTAEAGLSTAMDLGYYVTKGLGTYALGSALSNLAVSAGLAIGGTLGGVYAAAGGFVVAVAAYALWEGVDWFYGMLKEWLFE